MINQTLVITLSVNIYFGNISMLAANIYNTLFEECQQLYVHKLSEI